jgi:hypothetical protein
LALSEGLWLPVSNIGWRIEGNTCGHDVLKTHATVHERIKNMLQMLRWQMDCHWLTL